MPLTASTPSLYYEDRGSGDPLLLITGFAVSSAVLDPLAAAFATRLRCITYDHPASGRSSKRSFPATTSALADGAARVLDELGIESAHVAGISLGGVVAQQLALRAPHRVRGLILMSTAASARANRPAPRTLAPALARILAGSVQRRRVWLGPAFLSPGFLAREPGRADALLKPLTAHPAPPWGMIAQFVAAGLHDRTGDLHRVGAPTLVLHGDSDAAVALVNAQRLARAIPDAQLRVFPGAGHAFQFEREAETVATVCDWLARRRP